MINSETQTQQINQENDKDIFQTKNQFAHLLYDKMTQQLITDSTQLKQLFKYNQIFLRHNRIFQIHI